MKLNIIKKRQYLFVIYFLTIFFLISVFYISCNFNVTYSKGVILYFLQYPSDDFADSDTVIESIISSGYKAVIMDYSYDGSDQKAFKKAQIDKLKENGIIPICYISIGEAENYRFYWEEDGNDWVNESTGELNQNAPDWAGNYKVKYWKQAWKDIIKTYLDKILKAGFSGIYLDIVDDVGLQITDSGLFYYDLYYTTISGVGVEDLFYTSVENGDGTFSFIKNFELTEEDYLSYKRRIKLLKNLQQKGKIVFVVDYIDDKSGYIGENKERIDDFISKVKEEGFYYYIGTVDRSLDEINLIKY